MNEYICLEEAIPKFQIPNSNLQIISNNQTQNSNESNLNGLVIWKLRFGICLEFGYWDLGFPPDPLS
jgi:hypothetical protein